jgi:hypothetical protein
MVICSCSLVWLAFLAMVFIRPSWSGVAEPSALLLPVGAGIAWAGRYRRRRRTIAAMSDQVGAAVAQAGGWDQLQPEHRQRIELLYARWGHSPEWD